MNWFDSWALSLATFIPIVGMAIVLAIPRAKEELIKQVTLLATALTLAVGVVILFRFDYDNVDKLQFSVNKSWIDVISSRYHMGLDGISLPLVILTMGISLLCVIYSWDHFLFFIFFELVLLPMYFMIGVWGGPNREYASIKFFLFTLFGSALMLLSF